MIDNIVKIALNICTYHREEYLRKNLLILKQSKFFDETYLEYYGKLHIFIVDNASELSIAEDEHIHYIKNRNTGGSGGFQRGIEEIRRSNHSFTHVIFMDDDVSFKIESFYILYDFLKTVADEDKSRPVAGRMFCLDKPNIQFTAAEKWNRGNISHIEYMRDIELSGYEPGKVVYDSEAEYGGWWFCCFPMSFVKHNDVYPFFIHCDDVEYGLRCGQKPIIIEGVQVWHETYDKRITPLIQYYDIRNPLYVNELHGLLTSYDQIYTEWKQRISQFHKTGDWLSEYYGIRAMNDFLKGLKWLQSIDSEVYHKKLSKVKTNKMKNAIFWRVVAIKLKMRH